MLIFLFNFLIIFCISHSKLKHFVLLILYILSAVRECFSQMEGLKVKFESDCLVKEKEVSAIALPAEGSICLNNCLCVFVLTSSSLTLIC